MQDNLLASLHAQRSGIHHRWNALLHEEKPSTPLAHPDSLVHLIDWGLTEILAALRDPTMTAKSAHRRRKLVLPICPRGRNPLVRFFVAGEQALLETLVFAQARHRPDDPTERDDALNEMFYVIRTMAAKEIGSFCSLCGLCRKEAAERAAGLVCGG